MTAGNTKRQTYFAFQGLLMAVLLLLFWQQYPWISGAGAKLLVLASILGASMVFIRLAPMGLLSHFGAQASLFILDALLASATLHWTRSHSDLYFLYVIILFGTALTGRWYPTVLMSLLCSLLFLLSAWHPGRGLPGESEFWLRLLFLWVVTPLLAILSHDANETRLDRDRRVRERFTEFERMASIGRLAGEVAHRIKGPLTTIGVNAEVLSHRLKSPDAKKELKQIMEEAVRCREILKNLLDLGRLEEADFRKIDLREPVESAANALAPQLSRRKIALELRLGSRRLPLWADPSLLHEAVAAILQNSIEAIEKDGKIVVECRAPERSWWRLRQNDAEIEISDNGRGMTPGELENVFRPFYTTKKNEGSGLGLSAAMRILQKHGGFIEAFSNGPGQGARFILTVPLVARADLR